MASSISARGLRFTVKKETGAIYAFYPIFKRDGDLEIFDEFVESMGMLKESFDKAIATEDTVIYQLPWRLEEFNRKADKK